jgi:hypothetical protein
MKHFENYSPVILKENKCYTCLTNSTNTRYCALEITNPESNMRMPTQFACCGVNITEDDPICSNANSKCAKAYSGPPSTVKDKYNVTHPRTSQYDTFLNLFKCAAVTNKPTGCQTKELVIPNIGFFRNFLIANNSLDMWDRPIRQPTEDEVCFYNHTLYKKSGQALNF